MSAVENQRRTQQMTSNKNLFAWWTKRPDRVEKARFEKKNPTGMFMWMQHNKQQPSEPTVLIKAVQKVLKNILSNTPVDKNKKNTAAEKQQHVAESVKITRGMKIKSCRLFLRGGCGGSVKQPNKDIPKLESHG